MRIQLQLHGAKWTSFRAGAACRHAAVALAVSAALAAGLLASPVAARAQGPSIALGFGGTYGTPARTHQGVDVSCADGQEVCAPVSGTVSFAGYIPTTAGTRVRAVTIARADGSLVTISPLSRTGVVTGEPVTVGDALGTVGPSGDPSLASAHAHLSMRVAQHYVDPTSLAALLFAATAGTSARAVPAQPEPAVAPAHTAHVSVSPAASASLSPAVVSQPTVTLNPEIAPTQVLLGAGASAQAQLSRELARADQFGAATASQAVRTAAKTSIESPGMAASGSRAPHPSRGAIAGGVFLIGVLSSAAGVGVVQIVRVGVRSGRFVRAFAVRGNR